MKTTKKFTLMFAALAALNGFAFADAKGTEIMEKVADFKKPAFSVTDVYMILTDKKGTQDSNGFREYGKEEDGKTYIVMDFKTGTNKGTRFLQITNDNGPDEKHIYLPALKSVRRVNSSEGSKAFMGSDATYDDLSTRDVSEDEHEYLREESMTVESGKTYDCYVIKEIPIDKKGTQYNYRMVWVDKETMYPIHTEMYDKNDKLVKVLEVLDIQKIQGYDMPMENKLTNVQTGHSTTLKIAKVVALDQEIPSRYFTQNFLTTGK
ncbi:MAG: outer membrane lipoprotein-sorting protein [Spirochaetales bacterium]|nr:outer membrane lipoprotein-sorting protein [Spirochaetales bacterium]